MYKIKTTNHFEKDFIKCTKRKFNIDALGLVIEMLESTGKLPHKYKSHRLPCKPVIRRSLSLFCFKGGVVSEQGAKLSRVRQFSSTLESRSPSGLKTAAPGSLPLKKPES